MTREEFETLAKHMNIAFKGMNYLTDKNDKLMWYGYLRDIDFKVAKRAVGNCIKVAVYPPKIAEVLQEVETIMTRNTENEQQIKDIYKAMTTYYPMSLRDEKAKEIFMDSIKAKTADEMIENAKEIHNAIVTCVENMEKSGRDGLPILSDCIRRYIDEREKRG